MKHAPHAPPLVLCLLLAACGQMSAARQAYQEGNYARAESLATQHLRRRPDDAEAKQLQQEARQKVLVQLLADEQAARGRGDGERALDLLGQLLDRRRDWGARLDGAQAAILEDELQHGRGLVRAEVAPLLGRGRALAAEVRLARRRRLLAAPELAALGEELRAEVRRVGQGTCAQLVQGGRAEEPFWTRLSGRYCEHFGAQAPAARLPGLFGAVGLVGTVDGLPAAEHAALQRRLNEALARTPWYDPGGGTAGARLGGQHQIRYSSRVTERVHRWTVQVPYLDTEYYYETRQVPYQATEYYTVRVPHTTYQSYSYSCGYGTSYRTCSGSRPVTSYRSESRTRSVTRYRSQSDRKSRMVTRYRPEPRSASYVVNQRLGSYRTQLSVAVNLGAETPTLARAEAASELIHETSDYDHAKLEHTAPLPGEDAWLEPRAAALEGAFIWELRRAWFQGACGATAPSREQAARCLHGADELPQPARAALAAELREDAQHLIELVAPAR